MASNNQKQKQRNGVSLLFRAQKVKRLTKENKMTEEQVKFLCKWMVDNGNRPLTEFEKELIKQAIENAKSPQEMVISVLALLTNM